MTKIKEINLTELIKPYAKDNVWLALNTMQNKVLATGKTVKEVINNAKKVSKEKPVIMKAVQNYSTYIF
ncbi:MAG: hypothetical protein Q8N27_02565 [Candidatus Hydromicrobium sp.]|jgi:hypothetical protein|nr:hypothetical protein [Actinomycetota bacterium]MDP3011577.1 hypothetical protein [Candidatus Hydromicrobium sp.]